MKIGKIAQTYGNEIINGVELEILTDKEKTKEMFAVGYPFLKKVSEIDPTKGKNKKDDGIEDFTKRYYKSPIYTIDGEDYKMTSQLIDKEKTRNALYTILSAAGINTAELDEDKSETKKDTNKTKKDAKPNVTKGSTKKDSKTVSKTISGEDLIKETETYFELSEPDNIPKGFDITLESNKNADGDEYSDIDYKEAERIQAILQDKGMIANIDYEDDYVIINIKLPEMKEEEPKKKASKKKKEKQMPKRSTKKGNVPDPVTGEMPAEKAARIRKEKDEARRQAQANIPKLLPAGSIAEDAKRLRKLLEAAKEE